MNADTKERVKEIEKRLALIKWDMDHHRVVSKKHIYDTLKRELEHIKNEDIKKEDAN